MVYSISLIDWESINTSAVSSTTDCEIADTDCEIAGKSPREADREDDKNSKLLSNSSRVRGLFSGAGPNTRV